MGATTPASSTAESTAATVATAREWSRSAMRTATSAMISPANRMVAGGPIHPSSETTIAHASPAPMRSAKYSRPIASDRRPNSVDTTTPTAMNEANSAKQMTTRRATLENEATVPYSQIANVSIVVNATTQYPTRMLAAPSKKLQSSTASVEAARRRFEIVTITPPVPMPSSARPMTRYV